MASNKILEQKKVAVQEVTDKMQTAASTIIVDYRGLNVDEITKLRRELREAGVEMHVIKNNLLRRAATELGFEQLNDYLTGPNAALFSESDATAPARIAFNFAKNHEALELKGGVVDGGFVTDSEVKELAALPGREGMYSMLLSVLQAPIRNLALVTKAVAEQKSE